MKIAKGGDKFDLSAASLLSLRVVSLFFFLVISSLKTLLFLQI